MPYGFVNHSILGRDEELEQKRDGPVDRDRLYNSRLDMSNVGIAS
jgi:hypothetical protein